MTLWLARAGRTGEREHVALDNNVAVVGWEEMPDLADCTTRTRLQTRLRETYPEEKPRTLTSWQNQIWNLRDTMQPGDLVALPMKTRASIAFGVVAGPYAYRRDLTGGPVHTRPVEWMAQIPRKALDPDLLFSFGAYMTVCRIDRNGAEDRIRALLDDQPPTTSQAQPATNPEPAAPDRSYNMIRDRIAQRFKGHRMAQLIAALLEAQGYRARISQPGIDGGVDILAGSGPLGFDAPRLVVQVKSQDAKLDVRVLRELSGVMARFQADHGLLVGWGGFNQALRAEAATDYFRIRLWDAADVIQTLGEQYSQMPPDIRSEIPLKQVWTLAPEAHAA